MDEFNQDQRYQIKPLSGVSEIPVHVDSTDHTIVDRTFDSETFFRTFNGSPEELRLARLGASKLRMSYVPPRYMGKDLEPFPSEVGFFNGISYNATKNASAQLEERAQNDYRFSGNRDYVSIESREQRQDQVNFMNLDNNKVELQRRPQVDRRGES